MAISIRRAKDSDVDAMVKLVGIKRAELEAFEPVMWRPSREANEMTRAFFGYQVNEQSVILLVAEDDGGLVGFVNGVLQNAPPVYDPGGKAVMIDDFVAITGETGDQAASALLDAVMSEGRSRGAVQMIIVSAAKDDRADRWFRSKHFHVVSHWWNRVLSH